MVELTRRFFLGGAISLLAVQTSAMPKIMGNKPQIWGDGVRDDTFGLAALIRNEPVVLPSEKITIDDHGGVTFHRGLFRISQTIEIPDDAKLNMESPVFYGRDLDLAAPFFRAGPDNYYKFAAPVDRGLWQVQFRHSPGHKQLVAHLHEEPVDNSFYYSEAVPHGGSDISWSPNINAKTERSKAA